MKLVDAIGVSDEDEARTKNETDEYDPEEFSPPIGGRIRFGGCCRGNR
jgi:hypothetical protein